jgi:N-acyl-D-amino-acid deacylase
MIRSLSRRRIAASMGALALAGCVSGPHLVRPPRHSTNLDVTTDVSFLSPGEKDGLAILLEAARHLPPMARPRTEMSGTVGPLLRSAADSFHEAGSGPIGDYISAVARRTEGEPEVRVPDVYDQTREGRLLVLFSPDAEEDPEVSPYHGFELGVLAEENRWLTTLQDELDVFESSLPLPADVTTYLGEARDRVAIADIALRAGSLAPSSHMHSSTPSPWDNPGTPGRTWIAWKNLLRERWYAGEVEPSARLVLTPAGADRVTARSHLLFFATRFCSYQIGAREIERDGEAVPVRDALGEAFGPLVVAKADLVSVLAQEWLVDRGVLPRESLEESHATLVTMCFRALYDSAYLGMAPAHTPASLLILGWLRSREALAFGSEARKWEIDDTKISTAVRELTGEILRVFESGDPEEANRLLDTYAFLDAPLADTLGQFHEIPDRVVIPSFHIEGLQGSVRPDEPIARRPESPSLPRAAYEGAVRRSLPLLQASARTWYEKKDCFSCHHQGLGIATVATARELGHSIDDGMLEEQIETMVKGDRGLREFLIQGTGIINGQISMSYEMVPLRIARPERSLLTDATIHYLAGKQTLEGRWLSSSHRPPLEDSSYSATALSVASLVGFAPPGRAREMRSRVSRCREWLERARPVTTEERTMQLLGLHFAGAEGTVIERATKSLLREQREDGGFAQLPFAAETSYCSESDPYATGQALLALMRAGGVPATHPAIRKGLDYLVGHQEDDGSWHVFTRRTTPGLRYFETGFPHGIDQFISYAGTCFAVLALAHAAHADDAGLVPATLAFRGVAEIDDWQQREDVAATGDEELSRPNTADGWGMTPLMTAALTGTAGEMKALLEAGADPRLASKEGLTALHCAIHDPEKVQLLLRAGADPLARSGLGYIPGVLAAGFDAAWETMEILLSLDEVTGRDLDYSLLLAAEGGDAEKIRWLADAGARVEGDDTGRESPLLSLAALGDAQTTKLLLDHGARIDTDRGGTTALHLATRYGFLDVVDVLLSRGAAANARDEGGRTPLHLAAIVDPGHTDIVNALLLGGADPAATDAKGRTAADEAERLEHEAILKALRPTSRPDGS